LIWPELKAGGGWCSTGAADLRGASIAVRPPATRIRDTGSLEDTMPALRIRHCFLLIVLALLGSSASAAAQARTVATRPSHAAQLKSALRSVAAAQARHQTTKQAYASSATMLRVSSHPGVSVEIVATGPYGWQARARHQEQPGKSCVIFVGRLDGSEAPRTDADREMAGEEGVPLCDRMR
jgi:Tfp pilus assembly protein PilE